MLRDINKLRAANQTCRVEAVSNPVFSEREVDALAVSHHVQLARTASPLRSHETRLGCSGLAVARLRFHRHFCGRVGTWCDWCGTGAALGRRSRRLLWFSWDEQWRLFCGCGRLSGWLLTRRRCRCGVGLDGSARWNDRCLLLL